MTYLDKNRALWNARVAAHVNSDFYDMAGFRAGKSSLKPPELRLLGDLSGKSVLHLQCHFGQDTLSLARMGAEVTGLDFSDEAIRTARALAEELQLPASFVCGDLYDAPALLQRQYDVVFTSYGVIGWLPDLNRWAEVVASCLKPGGRFVFAGDAASSVYCFDRDGTRLWKLGTGGGSALSMQYRDERLYLVTTDGSLVCVDASEAAVSAAQQGTVPVARDVKLAAALPTYAPATTATSVATVPQPPSGAVVVQCVQHNGRLRVHVVSEGYDASWNVQFPRAIREPGARYVVDALHPAAGGFYRVRGEIRRLL